MVWPNRLGGATTNSVAPSPRAACVCRPPRGPDAMLWSAHSLKLEATKAEDGVPHFRAFQGLVKPGRYVVAALVAAQLKVEPGHHHASHGRSRCRGVHLHLRDLPSHQFFIRIQRGEVSSQGARSNQLIWQGLTPGAIVACGVSSFVQFNGGGRPSNQAFSPPNGST